MSEELDNAKATLAMVEGRKIPPPSKEQAVILLRQLVTVAEKYEQREAENARLREELNLLAGGFKRDLAHKLQQQTAKNKRLKEQLAAAQTDAARYRKIRSECGFDQKHFSVAIPNQYSWEVARTGEELDAATDSAMKEQP